MKFRLLGSALLMASLACMPEDPSIEQLPQEIVGGQTAGPDQFRAVGSLSFTNGSQFFSFCSGTLIAPQIVLTAAHCIPAREDLPFTRFILDSVTVSNPNRVVEVEEAIAHPQFNGNNLGAGRDIAIIHLKEPVNDIPPIPVNQDPVNDLVGRTFTAVGYGVTDFEGPGGGVKRFVEMTLLGFDSQLIFYGNANSNVCQGDSGGPDLMEIDGELRVIGVHSFVQAPFCHGTSASQRPDVQLDFIEDAINGTGLPDPQGGECEENGQCNAACGAFDPDCRCRQDGFCDTNCPGGRFDPDCCAADNNCNPACVSAGVDDIDCAAGGCAITPEPAPKTPNYPWGIFITLLSGVASLTFLVRRRR